MNVNRNYQVINTNNGKIIKGWLNGVPIEKMAIDQLTKISSLPFVYKHVAAMPDVHAGKGCTVGSVIATKGAVVPSFVGADLSCGMMAAHLPISRKDFLGKENDLFRALISAVPHGRSDNGGDRDIGRWQIKNPIVMETWEQNLEKDFMEVCQREPMITGGKYKVATHEQLGTLGTSNHFCEIAEDYNDSSVWVMVHSGSRGVGARIGKIYMDKAKELCKKWYIPLADPDLAYFPQDTPEYANYIHALSWAHKFANLNRKIMLDTILEQINLLFNEFINPIFTFDCYHNFASMENHFGENVLVTRKGAIRARENDWCLIPGSMGQKSYICKGKGNKDSFTSCSHGAGRAMSRTEAMKTISMERHHEALKGVTTYDDEGTLDESPDAYKDIDAVINAESDLVEVVTTVKQFICLKGKGEE
jgi:tRNA-splicing ligase RtcB